MYKRPLPKPRLTCDKPLARAESSPFWSMCQTNQAPPYVPKAHGPIIQIESLIFGLRRRGVPENHLEKLREENKYTPPIPVRSKKKKKKAPVEELVFSVPVALPKKKVLKAVVKKI
jgi:hypothetical protein